jgi:pyrimidine-specific ribonucleoside hydrolase
MVKRMRKTYLIIIIIYILLLYPSMSTPRVSQGENTSTPIPILLDVDVDTSDTNALLYLVNDPLIEIKAITVSCGVTYIDAGVENILRLLDYLELENIPVAGGSPTPLVTNHSFPVEWREASYNLYGVSLPPTTYQPANMNASELILATLNEADTPMNILALGPLTNIAHAIQKDPTITQKIARIDIMGGAVNVAGNIGNVYPTIPNCVAEWNFYIDPQAVEIVFSAIDDIRLVPLLQHSKPD